MCVWPSNSEVTLTLFRGGDILSGLTAIADSCMRPEGLS